MSRPKLLDGCCCQGAAGWGYHLAGFDVTGVDVVAQPRYPLPFIQADIVEYVAEHGHEYDVIHLSPPCQDYSMTERINGRGEEFPRLIAPLRLMLRGMGHPAWVIENVPGSPLENPVELCGAMFGLRTYRHRLFESNLPLTAPAHPRHVARQVKMGRMPGEGEFIQCVGNFSGVDIGRQAMEAPWMNRDGLREAIPVPYTRHLGEQILDLITELKEQAA
jgi:DNA (cytosine-5)-methyltransferase 1